MTGMGILAAPLAVEAQQGGKVPERVAQLTESLLEGLDVHLGDRARVQRYVADAR